MRPLLMSFLFPGGEPDHRCRLLVSMGECVSELGYAGTTIADVVRRAHVSKRTFYEHFADKEACYLATYVAVSDAILGRIAQAVAGGGDSDRQLRAALDAYIEALQLDAALSRSFLAEILGAGPRALEARRDVHRRFAALLRRLVDRVRASTPELGPLSPQMAMAIVGGVNELLLETFDSGESDLAAVAGPAFEFIRAVLSIAPEGQGQPL